MKVKVNTIIDAKVTDTIGKNTYLVALKTGGTMEQPEIQYEDYQVINAANEKDAVAKYNNLNNCDYFYGYVVKEIKGVNDVVTDDESMWHTLHIIVSIDSNDGWCPYVNKATVSVPSNVGEEIVQEKIKQGHEELKKMKNYNSIRKYRYIDTLMTYVCTENGWKLEDSGYNVFVSLND